MRARPFIATAAATVVGASLLIPAGRLGWIATIPAAAAVSAVVFLAGARPRSRNVLPLMVAVPGLVSVGATVTALLTGYRGDPGPGMWGLVEVGALLILLAVGVRWGDGPVSWVAVVAAACAQIGWILRFLPDRHLGALIAGCAVWSTGSAIAVVLGGYPRLAARRLQRTVSRARAQQRRQLERDLHDYVAHDLTGILVQAQAAQYAAKDDPDTLIRILARIESTAQNAMTAMDRALELLRDSDSGAPLAPSAHQPTLSDLPAAVTAFTEASTASVTTTYADEIDQVPREASAALYRVTIEALTNIRRHAPHSTAVSVTVTHDRPTRMVTVSVTNSATRGTAASPRPLQARSSGTGLLDAAAHIEALGGSLTAGPTGGGWSVAASVPSDDEEG